MTRLPPELPEYRLRVDRRARHVRLRVTPRGELVVTVPPGFPEAELGPILARRADWVRQVRARQHRHQAAAPEVGGARPREIRLAAIEEAWEVNYASVQARTLQALPRRRLLRVDARAGDEELGAALRRWLQARAKAVLPPWLARVSEETGLVFRSVGVRGQRSRWGSCSARGHISLNRNLLFLPADTVRYLLVHELCHTRHLDHSAAFWREVARHQADWRQQESVLREAGRRLPLWCHAP